MEHSIRFITNWGGKLDKGIYTTIRKYSQDKFLYYDSVKGHEFDVFLAGQHHSTAELLAVNTQELGAIPFGFLAIDTGVIDPDEVYAIFKKFGCDKSDTVIVLLFKTLVKTRGIDKKP